MEKIARICASELNEHNGLYVVDDAPFTGVAYFLGHDAYNGAYYIEDGTLLNKHHDAVLFQHKNKPWVPWENIISFYHEEAKNGELYDDNDVYTAPYLYQGKPFTGIWLCIEGEYESNDQFFIIKAIEDGYPLAELDLTNDGRLWEASYTDSILNRVELCDTSDMRNSQRILERLYLTMLNTKDEIKVSFNEEKVTRVIITNDMLSSGMKSLYNDGVIKRHYYDFNLQTLEYRDRLVLSGNGITKHHLQFLFASSPALPKVLLMVNRKTLSEEAFNYCKQELNIRCVFRYDTDY